MEETIEMNEKIETELLIKSAALFKTAIEIGDTSTLKNAMELMSLSYAKLLAYKGNWDWAFKMLKFYTDLRMGNLNDDQLMKLAAKINEGTSMVFL